MLRPYFGLFVASSFPISLIKQQHAHSHHHSRNLNTRARVTPMNSSASFDGAGGDCLADYFSDITIVDRLTHLFLVSYLLVVLFRLMRAPEVKLSICDAHLIDAVCQISTVSLAFATFRILRKENFNIQIQITSVLLTILAAITTFTFGISVGRSWGMAEAMLKGGENGSSIGPSSSKSKRIIRPKPAAFHSDNSGAHSSDDSSSLMSVSSSSRRKAAKAESLHAKQNKSAFLLSKEEDDKKKKQESEVEATIFETVESAKVNLLSNLELNLLPSGMASSSGGDISEWKLVRTGYSSHIWLSKQRRSGSASAGDRANSVMIKASCFSAMSVTDVAMFLHANDITTGLECIFKHRTAIQSLKNERVQVSRVSVSSTLAVAKRDFVAATYWLEIPETRSVVICTQSMPLAYSPKVKGVTRGISLHPVPPNKLTHSFIPQHTPCQSVIHSSVRHTRHALTAIILPQQGLTCSSSHHSDLCRDHPQLRLRHHPCGQSQRPRSPPCLRAEARHRRRHRHQRRRLLGRH